MRLLELEVKNMRGLCDFRVEPQGDNVVIWGPNGCGKSGVVDAIDFLLTGRIARLSGTGTAGITLRQHGPHVDSTPDKSVVRAKLKLPGIDDPVGIERCIANPETLKCDNPKLLPVLEPVAALARRGQHVLTRTGILRFITAQGAKRAEQVQELLNISEIDDIRKALRKLESDQERTLQAGNAHVQKTQAAVATTVGQASFQADAVLKEANEARAILSGTPIAVLHSSKLKEGLSRHAAGGGVRPPNGANAERDVQTLRGLLTPANTAAFTADDKQLCDLVSTFRQDAELLVALQRLDLVRIGYDLMDATGSCPLCDTAWPEGELRKHLAKKLDQAEDASKRKAVIGQLVDRMTGQVAAVASCVERLRTAAAALSKQEEAAALDRWHANLEAVLSALEVPLERYPTAIAGTEHMDTLLAPRGVERILVSLGDTAKGVVMAPTPQQTAWDLLTVLVANLKALEDAESERGKAAVAYHRAMAAHHSFVSAKDAVLGELYDSVKEQFVALYRQLHPLDEGTFDARLEPKDAALEFEVDFYGRGVHPPHALHSEGHQDSMGLCLFLALAERLTKGVCDLIVLDDVVMSIDSRHRRQICGVLKKELPHRQFLVTTHDANWAYEMKTEGLVNKKGMVGLCNWHLETGPQVRNDYELWNRIRTGIANDDVNAAAATLRHGLEHFFALACDRLHAPVRYRMDGRAELGDLEPAAWSQYGSLLGKAKKSANSWGNTALVSTLASVEARAKEAHERAEREGWAINPSVHFNEQYNLGAAEFAEVLEAYEAFSRVFQCDSCGSLLYVSTQREELDALRCDCGAMIWNLREKPRSN